MSEFTAGLLGEGIPYLAVGDGPPLVMVQGLTPTHDVPTGMERRMTLPMVMPLSGEFRVHLVNGKQGLRPGASMSEIAGHLATVIEDDLGEPVFLTRTSTGGSVALQLSVDRPIWFGPWWWSPRHTGSGQRADAYSTSWRGLPALAIRRAGSGRWCPR